MKMKKIVGLVLVSVVAFLAVPANAQIRFGAKGGVNISKIHFSGNEYINDVKSSTGFQVGPMMEIGVPYTGFGLEVALLYSQMGYEAENKSYNSDYLDIPLLLKWKMDLPLVPLKPYLGFGPDFSFRVGKPKEIKEEFDTKGFGIGLNIGAGVEVFKHLQVGLNYNFGLTDDVSSKDTRILGEYSGKRRNWAITAAILF